LVPASPTPRRIATPSWLDLRLVLGVLLVLASVLVGAEVVSNAGRTYPVVAVTHDLAAGTVLTDDDVTLRQVQLPGHGKGIYLTAKEKAIGKRLQRPVSRDELLPAGAVTGVGAQVKLTVPLAAGNAPTLHAGQRIEVWLSTSNCASVVLLADVTVQSVHADAGSSLSDGNGGQDVVVDVEPAAADRVIQALAIDAAQLRAGILIGSATPTGPPGAPAAPTASPSSTDAPSGAASTQPDVASCGSPSATR
jgi:SAF domain